jgi:hypothetical protein
MKRPLKLGFIYSFSTAENFFVEALSRRFDVIRDDKNPDYLIFGDLNPNQSFYAESHYNWDQFTNPNMVTIAFTGENVRPPLDKADFAITFDHLNSSRHYRLPLYVVDMYGAVKEGWTDNFYQLVNLKHDYEKDYDERKFCSFVVSNPRQEMRNAMFGLMNTYKGVHSAGPHLNNMGSVLPRDKLVYKLDFLNNYRFNICFENGSYPGYVTEKLFNALQVKTMPVYWGSPTVGRDFNTDAFINCHNFKTLNEVVKYVEHLDSQAGKQEYLDIIERPAFKNDIPNEFTDLNNFCDWWEQFVVRQ